MIGECQKLWLISKRTRMVVPCIGRCKNNHLISLPVTPYCFVEEGGALLQVLDFDINEMMTYKIVWQLSWSTFSLWALAISLQCQLSSVESSIRIVSNLEAQESQDALPGPLSLFLPLSLSLSLSLSLNTNVNVTGLPSRTHNYICSVLSSMQNNINHLSSSCIKK